MIQELRIRKEGWGQVLSTSFLGFKHFPIPSGQILVSSLWVKVWRAGLWFSKICLNCRKAVICYRRISSAVYMNNLEALAGKGPMQSLEGGVGLPLPSVWLSSLSSWPTQPREARRFSHRPQAVDESCTVPSLEGWFVNVLNSRTLGGLTTERGVCFSTGYTCPKSSVPSCFRLWFVLLLKDCTLQINHCVHGETSEAEKQWNWFSFLWGPRDNCTKLFFHLNEHSPLSC